MSAHTSYRVDAVRFGLAAGQLYLLSASAEEPDTAAYGTPHDVFGLRHSLWRRTTVSQVHAPRSTSSPAGLSFQPHQGSGRALTLAPAPILNGAVTASETGELYWMALLRDVHFNDFDGHPRVQEAAASLSDEFSEFPGPKDARGRVTPATLFRGATPGDVAGPYVSQFLLRGSRDERLGLRAEDGVIQ